MIVPKICDFGVAKHEATGLGQVSTGLTQSGGMLGSPMYMAPEHAKNAKDADFRSDVWSLCITMHEALSGQKPWSQCASMGELMLALYSQDVTPIEEIAPWVPELLAKILKRGLQRSPGARYQSMREVLGDLEKTGAVYSPITQEDLLTKVPQAASTGPRQTKVSIGPQHTELGHSTTVATSAPAKPAQPLAASKSWVLPIAAVAIAVGAFTTYQGTKTPSTPAQPGTSAPTTSAAVWGASSVAIESHEKQAKVRISPPDAVVKVDGVIRQTVEGNVTLAGEPGSVFVVIVSTTQTTKEVQVVISAQGAAIPAEVSVGTDIVGANRKRGIKRFASQ